MSVIKYKRIHSNNKGSGGSGGGETLAQTLVLGNTTGGRNIVVSNTDFITNVSGNMRMNFGQGTDSWDITSDAGVGAQGRLYVDPFGTQMLFGVNSYVVVNASSVEIAHNTLVRIESPVATTLGRIEIGTYLQSSLLVGGTAVGSGITLKSTTGAGITTGLSHQFTGGTNGAATIASMYNDGQFLVGTTTRNPTALGIFRVGQGTSTLDIGQVTAGSSALWMAQASPTTTNYALSHSGTTFTVLNAPTTAGTISFSAGGSGTSLAAFRGPQTSSVVTSYAFTPANEAGLTAGTEKKTFDVATATIGHATGALTTQRFAVINAPTYSFIGASTLTTAATLAITAAPIAGTNATITNSIALWVQGGKTQLDGDFATGNKVIDTTAGDAATINSIAGRFRKDTTGATFTLTNSFITANSIILLTYSSDPGVISSSLFVVPAAGSAVITFQTVPLANTDVNFFVIN